MDLDEAPIIHGLELPSRCICAQSADTNITRFMVATQSLRQENQLHYVEFDDENNVIDKTMFSHPIGEVWHLSASFNNPDVFTSCYQSFENGKLIHGCMVGKLPLDENQKPIVNSATTQDITQNQQGTLENLATLDSEEFGNISSSHWKPIEGENFLMALAGSKMLLYDMEQGTPKLSDSFELPTRKGHPCTITSGRWNPHHGGKQFAAATEQNVVGWDIRSKSQAFIIEGAHGQLVRDVDFNPNKMYYVVTCGDDCQVKFWDTRDLSDPVKVLSDDHSHWVWSTRYNPFHDQLVLSGGSDSRVILYNMKTISSEPFETENLSSDDDASKSSDSDDEFSPEKRQMEDGVIGVYEEHEDSVYAVEWSAADPWTFASLSYDGRFVINRVPKKVKYGILL
uniref:EARP-interacting protein homolog n=1 Tax=Styela clava TaxID=7725 RepID=UPI00193A87DA|nr:EARP-interacting protein homolog [Styela clava]